METFRGIPISKIREHYMREGHRNEMFSSMIADVIEGNPGALSELENMQQEQRIWELDSDEQSIDEEKQKKRAKNKKKYLRKKEKALAEKEKQEEVKGEEKGGVEHGLAGLAIQDATALIATDDRKSDSGDNCTAAASPPPSEPKLSKRQKKTLLKKAKQAQNKTPTPELVGSSTTGDFAPISNDTKFEFVNHEDRKKENKVDGSGHGSPDDNEKEAATESEFEAVMDTVAKRFGQ
ncbi:hypothetical protein KCU65_g2976, partial [Aureobasidium melanogenum]